MYCFISFNTNPEKSMKDIRPQNINKYQEKREVVNTFRELVTAVERISGKRVCLNEPATLHEINQVEQIVGHQFPEDVRKIYLLANGQRQENVNKMYLPNGREEAECVPLFEDGYPLMSLAYTFMPLEEVKNAWLSMKEAMDWDPDCGALYNIQGAVKGYH